MLKKVNKSKRKFNEKEFFSGLSAKCEWEGGIVGMGWFRDELESHFPEKLKMFEKWVDIEERLQNWISANTPEERETK